MNDLVQVYAGILERHPASIKSAQEQMRARGEYVPKDASIEECVRSLCAKVACARITARTVDEARLAAHEARLLRIL